mmetsp:Transcript_45295/g.98573  ORF Transcript_45295/g.98573 Transcript_45295/m.98573 type:complete len:310 (+) Transcript_45295:259-1188(+)
MTLPEILQHHINQGLSWEDLGSLLGCTCLQELGWHEVVDGQVGGVLGISFLRLCVIDLETFQDLLETHVVFSEEHGSSLGWRKAVAIDVRQVDVGRASDKAFFQDLETLVDQRIEEPLDNLLITDWARGDTLGFSHLVELGYDFRVHGLVASTVDENATSIGLDRRIRGLHAEATQLAEPVGQLVGAEVGLGLLIHVTSRLALLPEELLSDQVTQCHGTHGHAESSGRFVDLLHGAALLPEHLRFARVGCDHAISNKAVAVANHHALLVDEFSHRHACGQGLHTALGGAHVLQELHDVGWREEVRSHDT